MKARLASRKGFSARAARPDGAARKSSRTYGHPERAGSEIVHDASGASTLGSTGVGGEGNWQHLALEIVERAAEARQRAPLLGDLFELLERRIGFDSASVTTTNGDLFRWRKPPACRLAWAERCQSYLRELAPCLRLAAAHGDVAQDVDALSGLERGRASFYLIGARSYAFVLVRSSEGLVAALSLSRPEPRGFVARELELLRQLRPALSLTGSR